jgi:hypothetical protein
MEQIGRANRSSGPKSVAICIGLASTPELGHYGSVRLAVFAIAFASAVLSAAATAAPPAGHYRLVGVHDAASELILYPDGRFEYALAYGALDEQAQGRWTSDGKTVHLSTLPKPKPAVFSAGRSQRDAGAPFAIKVTSPDGRGLAGVDFRLTFDSGDPVESYTQEYGWSLDPADKRRPMSIRFEVPMYGLESQVFTVDVATANQLTFILTPNDLGTIDFENVPVTIGENALIMHRQGGDLTYVSER